MSVAPGEAPVTRPAATLAVFEFAEVHVSCEVTSAVLPSEYVPLALNCCVPATRKYVVAGEIAIAVSVAGFGVTVTVTDCMAVLFPFVAVAV